jgi:protein-disulfide isomerase
VKQTKIVRNPDQRALPPRRGRRGLFDGFGRPGRPGLVALVALVASTTATGAGCVKKQGAGDNCRCPKTQGAQAAVKPPEKKPDCQEACRYFVYCQSARWSDEQEQKALRERCEQDCAKMKTAGPDSQEAIFFGGVKKCAVGKGCVKFGQCMRDVIAELRKAMTADQPQEDPNAVYQVPVADSPTRGPADAPVTVVMFADYECPFCGQGWETLTKLEKAYPGKVRVVYKHYPLPSHPRGKVGAQAALCVMKQKGMDAFWKYHERLYKLDDALSDDALLQNAVAVGADRAKIKSCLDKTPHAALLKADLELGARLGIGGTPAFFFNGKKMGGAQPLSKFKEAYADALARAKAAIKEGVAPAKVYPHLIKDGATRPVMLEGKGASREPQGPPELDPTVAFRIPVSRNDAAKGPADALVTIVEFADFQCPACGFAAKRMNKLLAEFPKDVRLVYRHLPLPSHPDAALAAEAALAVRAQKGDEGFFAYHDKLYDNPQGLSRPVLERLAKELGVNMARFKKALDERTYQKQVERDQQFATRMSIMGTPAFFINGRIMMGVPRTYEELKKRIEQEISAAKKKLEGDVTRKTLYEHLQKQAKTEPVYKKTG